MNTADLITSFFNNEMSPDQERQFLLSVASSDSLRLGLKSHVMLDKILQEQSNQSRVSSQVRMNIMKQAAVVAAAGSALAAEKARAADNGGVSSPARQNASSAGSSLSGSRGLFRWSSAALALLLGVGGFFAGMYTGAENGGAGNGGSPVVQASEKGVSIVPEMSGVNAQIPASSSSAPATAEELDRQTASADRLQEGENGQTVRTNAPASRADRQARVLPAGEKPGAATPASSLTQPASQKSGTAAASTTGQEGTQTGTSTIQSDQLQIINADREPQKKK